MGICDSDPFKTCDQTQVANEFNTMSESLANLLDSTNTKIQEIIGEYEQCCEETNANLGLVINRLETAIGNAAECCDEMLANWANILNALNGVVNPGATTTTTTVIATTTTTVASSTTTTTVPVTTTTTTVTGTTIYNDYFTVSEDEDFVCQDPEVLCYYKGIWGAGTIMYSDALATIKLTGYSYIRRVDTVEVYTIGDTTAVVGAFYKNCE